MNGALGIIRTLRQVVSTLQKFIVQKYHVKGFTEISNIQSVFMITDNAAVSVG